MPQTSSGETVYAAPDAADTYVQSDANTFSLSTQGSPSEWTQFLEKRQVQAKARIDEFCGRDFEDHASDTVTLDGGARGKRILYLPSPVRSVSEVRIDGEALAASTYRAKPSGQLIRLGTDGSEARWPAGYGNIAIDLDWGYQTPPADIAEAEQKLVAHTVANLAQLREGQVVQQDDVDLKVNLPSAMTAEVRGILRAHRDSGRTMGLL
ncbi:hypothetical protein [Halomarina rubra]|uniref:Uncharacterized protein n=1 Tax=Halomarina rubra TaxID=2071873 RepID=A0ABD6B0X1_9EURY|nr:hypothetical protein [Halomarina rubra]